MAMVDPRQAARMLVLDSSPSIALMVSLLLRQAGYAAETVPDLPALQAALRLPDVRIVLAGADQLDRVLPARAESAAARDVAVIGIGAVTHALAAQLAGNISRPVQAAALLGVVERALAANAPQLHSAHGIDETELARLWNWPESRIFVRVARSFLGEMDRRISTLQSAMAAEDRATLEHEAHTIAGAAGNVAAATLAEAARAVQRQAASGDIAVLRAQVTALLSVAARDLPVLAALVHGAA